METLVRIAGATVGMAIALAGVLLLRKIILAIILWMGAEVARITEPDVCRDGAAEMRMAEARVGDEFGAFFDDDAGATNPATPTVRIGEPLNTTARREIELILEQMGA